MKGILAALIVISMVSSLQAQSVGIQLYSLRNQFPKDVKGTLAKIKSWGVKVVEGGDTYGLPLDDFKKLLKDNGISAVSIGSDFNKLDTDPQSFVTLAKAYGAKYVVCTWIPHKGDEFTIEDMKKAVAVFSKAGKILKENGIAFCFHPHGFEFRSYEDGTLFDYMVKNTDPAFVNFEMDVYWVKHPGQDPVALLNKYPNRFLLMHLKDRAPGTVGNQNGKADVETNVTLGKGDVGIAEVMKTAKKIGVKYYFIEDESSRSEQQIPESLAYLKTLK